MAMFSKLIICSRCGSRFKTKKERAKIKYICSRYDNKGDCKRIPMHEEFLKEVIDHRFKRELTEEEIRENVLHIEVENKMLFKVYLKDQEPIVFEENRIIY